ncbi:hypothetical protein NQ317_018967 [Molorchus minor]|uniref:HTH CENPB-type domain-containing protein n=1 Tax=Molorchus minor TaxID=1323400 RepID=A0ABQ9JJN3_9CUCU|nr:hypothetical protein NQ317_018967 [Molorchus minor]
MSFSNPSLTSPLPCSFIGWFEKSVHTVPDVIEWRRYSYSLESTPYPLDTTIASNQWMNDVHLLVFIHWHIPIFSDMDRKRYTRFKYSEEVLATALDEIKNGVISINKASTKYGIPKSTLHNKINGKVPIIRKMRPSTFLTPDEETRLVKWIISKAKFGFPIHPEEVKDSVQRVLKESSRPNKFIDDRPGTKWLKLFLLRRPKISKRNTEIISKSRASVTEPAIRQWFADLKKYLEDENIIDIMNDASRIFNADETGMRTRKRKESITVLCNYSANGTAVPPMIVFPYKRIPKELALSVPQGWAIGRSDSGWMTSATTLEYVANVFYLGWWNIISYFCAVILFVDGHKSHYNLELYDFCVDKKIVIYCLYPNATHMCNRAILLFKEAFDRACESRDELHILEDAKDVDSDINSVVLTESFIENLPMEIDGILYDPVNAVSCVHLKLKQKYLLNWTTIWTV